MHPIKNDSDQDEAQPLTAGAAAKLELKKEEKQKPAQQKHKPEEGGIFPLWPFRFTVLAIGLLLLAAALLLRFTLFKSFREPSLSCYAASQIQYNGIAVDFCAYRTQTTGGTECGSPAADLFCVKQGYVYGYNWTQSLALVNNTIALGNNALGGQQAFDGICCDNRSYWPTAPRWLLWVSGVLLLYLISVAIAKFLILAVEVILVGLVATESLYFFSGFEPILKQVTYSVGLVIWTGQSFWVIWCNPDYTKECEDRWLKNPIVLQRVAKCIMAFQLGRLGAVMLGKAFGWAYFFRNQLPQLRRVLKQERYLAAMSTPHWARALIFAQEESAAETATTEARGAHPVVVGGPAHPAGAPVPQFHGGSVLAYLKHDKELFTSLPRRVQGWFEKAFGPGGFLHCCKRTACCSCCTTGGGCFGTCFGKSHNTDEEETPEGIQQASSADAGMAVSKLGFDKTAGSTVLQQSADSYQPAPTTAMLHGTSTMDPHTRYGVTQFDTIPEAHAVGGASKNRKISTVTERDEVGNTSETRPGAPAFRSAVNTVIKTQAVTRVLASSQHGHHRLAGLLETGPSRPHMPFNRPHSLSGAAHELTGQRNDSFSHNQLPDLRRRSVPVVSQAENSLLTETLLHAAQQAHEQSIAARKAAVELNADLVAVDVGGVGALQKFSSFLRKYQAMSDDQLNKETEDLARRLFSNLKAYLNPTLLIESSGPSFGNALNRDSISAVALQSALEGNDQSPRNSNGNMDGRLSLTGHMRHSSSSPALHADGNAPDAILFSDFVSALRRAKKSFNSMSLSRSSTASLASTAKEAWQMFDKQNASKLTEDDVRSTLQEVYKSRRNLALSIRANQAVCRSLTAATGFVIQTALVFVYMGIFGLVVAFSSGLDYFKTYVVAFSFIFGESVKTLFQNAIYLFAEHPFDVGDVLRIGSTEWIVDSFDLMFTVMVSTSGEWTTYTNTAMMNSQPVNLSRSKARTDVIKIKVPAEMPLEVLQKVNEAMKKVHDGMRAEMDEKSIGCSIAEMQDSQTLVLAAKFKYTFPPSETGRMGKAKSAMQEVVIQTLLKEGVQAIPMQLDFGMAKLKSQ